MFWFQSVAYRELASVPNCLPIYLIWDSYLKQLLRTASDAICPRNHPKKT